MVIPAFHPVREDGEGTVSSFEADDKIQQIAEAYSLDMVDYAQQHFGVRLDWSERSIERLERIAATLHEQYMKDRPSAEQIEPFFKMLGSYMGEVFRKNHGAEWGWVSLQGNRFPGMQRAPSTLFWPWGRAQNRVVNGAEDNLLHYYQHLLHP